ncbi:carboxymuconolactone decarboxylase family protein [Nonomuraea composti]|uniref:carboxymuconolactone decarboxylase family protein n=1 Tax=Nonomuraea composti TaxID=2720023 RepID=UPI0019800E70
MYADAAEARKAGVTDDQLITVAAWRQSPYFTDAERAALALAEAATRMNDRAGDAIPDAVWDELVEHYDERQRRPRNLVSLVLAPATRTSPSKTAFAHRRSRR